ncbi:two-component system regulatory protein YycI [Alkalihalophilus lindianensis]|jgi:regulatory protein YycI of two-component signal transduction system YycFG|uniref:Two-component system regulatory protein YycI n=1 Tax=Alkalihalophilus lindianensis TaxID=1630542 RepID=A0ABU3X9X9_9BACI|nr:two-component system regulatory protein YycI [Alkalihalophilus lindianensis]MDV2684691.1 two-component system regulatory protein YycI [Alkalihalophilus lindianensis]
MNWNRTKTIFIITFLFLNIFLTWQLIDKNNSNQMNMIAQATIQEVLRDNNVRIDVELPEETISAGHVLGKTVPFSERQMSALSNQEAELVDGTTIISTLDEPVPLREGQFSQDLSQFLNSYVTNGNEYRFGRFDTEERQVLLQQTYEEKTAHAFEAEPLLLQLNEDGEIVGYQQSYYEFEPTGREREVLSSIKAIEVLLNAQYIGVNNTVTHVEFGYYSFYSPQGGAQVFAPMWRVTVEGETYLVHAINPEIQQLS